MKSDYYLKNKEKLKEYKKEYRKNNRKLLTEYNKLWRSTPNGKLSTEKSNCRKYGLTIGQLEQMNINQNGVCAICSKKFENRKETHVDHNHVTGKVRQLLCKKCNWGIACLKEDVLILQKAIEYLNKWNT